MDGTHILQVVLVDRVIHMIEKAVVIQPLVSKEYLLWNSFAHCSLGPVNQLIALGLYLMTSGC